MTYLEQCKAFSRIKQQSLDSISMRPHENLFKLLYELVPVDLPPDKDLTKQQRIFDKKKALHEYPRRTQ